MQSESARPRQTAAGDVFCCRHVPLGATPVFGCCWTGDRLRQNDLYCEYSMRHGATVDMRAWRTPEWKLLIDFAHPGRAELYDLAHDPAESRNLIDSADEHVQQVRRDLEAKIRAKWKEIQDPVLAEVWQ